MRWIALLSLFLPIVSLTKISLTNAGSPDDFQICFFELNNTTTSTNLKTNSNFKENLAKGTKIHTYTPESADSLANFKKMIEETSQAGKRCDSLVISGHHTGNWYGQFGGLKLKDIESLSCDPKYKDWFQNIRSLWLDGCNTVTDNLINGSTTPPTPDSESARVAEKETKDKNQAIPEYRIKNLNQAYTLSLDKNTPLSSRYLRAFPNTQIYGFNGATPEGTSESNQVGSRSFIANHLSLIGQALKDEENYLGQEEDIADIKLGLTALFSDICDEDRISAWEEVGNPSGLQSEAIENQNYEMAQKLGCDLILAKQVLDDPNSESAIKALANKIKQGGYPQELLNLANTILNSRDESVKSQKAQELAKKLVEQTLDTIAKEDEKLGSNNTKLSLSHLLFNNIYETWTTAKKYEKRDSRFFNSVKRKLQSNTFTSSLQNRIESSQTSSIRKADYIKFYMDVNETKPAFINKAINDLVVNSTELFKELKSPRDSNLTKRSRRALALSVVDQLLQYNLLTDEQKETLLKSEALFPKNTKDSFNRSINIKLRIATDEQEILNDIQSGTGSFEYRRDALTGITEYYFQTEKTKEFTDMMNKVVINNNDNRKTVWNKMHIQLQVKTKEERINFMADLINNPDQSAEKTRAFVSQYGSFLPENEKRELCDKIIAKYTWYKNNSIKCPQ